jgi:hypothetical protein
MGSSVWGVINKQVKISKIKRYPWKKILGTSLTKVIVFNHEKYGYSAQVLIDKLIYHPAIDSFIRQHPSEAEDIKKNIRISVCARIGENNSSDKVKEELHGK